MNKTIRKNSIAHYDAIIIGQGLAGSLLAWEMIKSGQRIIVIDNKHHGSSSKVAAGIINPITGHRINLTSGFVDYLCSAKKTYQQLTDHFGNAFLTSIAQQRLIKNQGQKNYYLKRLEQEHYQPFIQTLSHNFNQKNIVLKNAEFGIGNIQQTYKVDTNALLKCIYTWLKDKNALLNLKLDYQNIQINSNIIRINGPQQLTADKIIFCEGFQAIHNPWLQTLPFKLSKGDILTVQLNKINESMLNWGHWILPLSSETKTAIGKTKYSHKAYLGSSYQWQNISLEPCNTIAKELLDSLSKHTSLDATLLKHHTGIRPTTNNRKQLIGVHPQHQNLYCFNGFGSKGCLTIPYYAKQFVRHFSHQEPLDELIPELDSVLAVNASNTDLK